MKVSILKQDLLPILQAVSRSVGVRSSLPVLANILIQASKNKLKIAATNLEIGVIKTASAQVLEDGETTIPAKTITETIAGLPDQNIDLEVKADILQIQSGKFQASVNGISAQEFPVIPTPSGEAVNFDKQILLSCTQIMFAAAADGGRPVLTGILIETKGEKLNFVATDGFRLAFRQISLPKGMGSFKSLIPKRTLEEVVRIISEDLSGSGEDDKVTISSSQNQNQVIFEVGSTIISSRLIEGQFPDWEKIIPQKFICRAVVERGELVSAVKLASIFARNEASVVTLEVSVDKISLTSETKEVGQQQNEVDAQIEGENIKIAFNTRFLLDALVASDSSSVTMEFSGSLSPTVIKPVGEEELIFIVMPIRKD